jgi:hypothetical protein
MSIDAALPLVDEPMVLVLQRNGVVLAQSMVYVPGPVAIRAVNVVVTYDHHDGPAQAVATLHPTIEDIAAYVAGDGADAQRVAIADGIRRGWGS